MQCYVRELDACLTKCACMCTKHYYYGKRMKIYVMRDLNIIPKLASYILTFTFYVYNLSKLIANLNKLKVTVVLEPVSD